MTLAETNTMKKYKIVSYEKYVYSSISGWHTIFVCEIKRRFLFFWFTIDKFESMEHSRAKTNAETELNRIKNNK